MGKPLDGPGGGTFPPIGTSVRFGEPDRKAPEPKVGGKDVGKPSGVRPDKGVSGLAPRNDSNRAPELRGPDLTHFDRNHDFYMQERVNKTYLTQRLRHAIFGLSETEKTEQAQKEQEVRRVFNEAASDWAQIYGRHMDLTGHMTPEEFVNKLLVQSHHILLRTDVETFKQAVLKEARKVEKAWVAEDPDLEPRSAPVDQDPEGSGNMTGVGPVGVQNEGYRITGNRPLGPGGVVLPENAPLPPKPKKPEENKDGKPVMQHPLVFNDPNPIDGHDDDDDELYIEDLITPQNSKGGQVNGGNQIDKPKDKQEV